MGTPLSNPYDDVLKVVSEEMFNGIPMNMKMSPDGKPFPEHIAFVIQAALKKKYGECALDNCQVRQKACEAINKFMRGDLVRQLFHNPVEPAPGLEKFLSWLPKGNNGIITGDLRQVAKALMTVNAFGDLRKWFPEKNWACGDDPDIGSRLDQVWAAFDKIKPLDPVVFIDDSANGIKAMREFADTCLAISCTVVGVATGNSTPEELLAAGADLVAKNVGWIPDALN